MGSQINDIFGRMESFEKVKDDFGNMVQFLNVVIDEMNTVKQELFLIKNNQKQQQNTESQKSKTSDVNRKPSTPPSTATPIDSAESSSSPPCVAPIPRERTGSSTQTLFIGDSISANVHLGALQEATQTKFTTARAYSSTYDIVKNAAKQPARFPSSNFTEVVPTELSKGNFKTLILQAGSVDITNLNTKDNPEAHIEYFRQETIKSATALFATATNALKVHPTLTKVIIMNQIPRYDPLSVDPLSLKPALSHLFNVTLTELFMKCTDKEKIFVGSHNIECSGAIKESRYRHTKSGKYDGIHLFGSSGQKAYTKSVLNILKSAKITDSEFEYHFSRPQFRYQNRRSANHRNNHTGSNFRKAIKNIRPDYFQVPTYNRFSVISDQYQGNW